MERKKARKQISVMLTYKPEKWTECIYVFIPDTGMSSRIHLCMHQSIYLYEYVRVFIMYVPSNVPGTRYQYASGAPKIDMIYQKAMN